MTIEMITITVALLQVSVVGTGNAIAIGKDGALVEMIVVSGMILRTIVTKASVETNMTPEVGTSTTPARHGRKTLLLELMEVDGVTGHEECDAL